MTVIGRDRDVGDGADGHAAELDRGAHVEPLYRLVEVADRRERLAPEPSGTEPEEGAQHRADGEQDEQPELPVAGGGGRHLTRPVAED